MLSMRQQHIAFHTQLYREHIGIPDTYDAYISSPPPLALLLLLL